MRMSSMGVPFVNGSARDIWPMELYPWVGRLSENGVKLPTHKFLWHGPSKYFECAHHIVNRSVRYLELRVCLKAGYRFINGIGHLMLQLIFPCILSSWGYDTWWVGWRREVTRMEKRSKNKRLWVIGGSENELMIWMRLTLWLPLSKFSWLS